MMTGGGEGHVKPIQKPNAPKAAAVATTKRTMLRGVSTMEQPEAPQRHADADSRRQRENELDDKFPVLHPYLLAQAFNLNGHEIDPQLPFYSVGHSSNLCYHWANI